MEKEFLNGLMEQYMKENIKMIRRMEKESLFLKRINFMKVIGLMIYHMEKAYIILMTKNIKVYLNMEK